MSSPIFLNSFLDNIVPKKNICFISTNNINIRKNVIIITECLHYFFALSLMETFLRIGKPVCEITLKERNGQAFIIVTSCSLNSWKIPFVLLHISSIIT